MKEFEQAHNQIYQSYLQRIQDLHQSNLDCLRSVYDRVPTSSYANQQALSQLQRNIKQRLLRIENHWQSSLSEISKLENPRTSSAFNGASRRILIAAFHKNSRPNEAEKYALAEACHLDYSQVCVWFSNRRTRNGIAHDAADTHLGGKSNGAMPDVIGRRPSKDSISTRRRVNVRARSSSVRRSIKR